MNKRSGSKNMENYVKLSKVVEKLNLKNLTPDVDMTEKSDGSGH